MSIAAMLALTAFIAAWFSAWLNIQENHRLEARIAALRPLAKELVVREKSKLSIIQRTPLRFDQFVWEVNVPDVPIRLNFANQNVATSDSPSMFDGLVPQTTAVLPPGRHTIELKLNPQPQYPHAEALIDGQAAMKISMSKDWSARGSSQGGGSIDEQVDVNPKEPYALFRRSYYERGHNSVSSKTPVSESLMLWVAPEQTHTGSPTPAQTPSQAP